MKVALLGATGRTGRLVAEELLRRGHRVKVLVRDATRLPELGTAVAVLTGDVRDPAAVTALVTDVDAVVSALGPTSRDATVHEEAATAMVEAMRTAGVRRFVGISAAGVDVPGDLKRRRDKAISAIIHRFGGAMAADKGKEFQVWAASDLDWTLVRPPRLTDGPPAPAIEHDPHRSTRSTRIARVDLATFVVDVVEQGSYLRSAPFVAGARSTS